MFLIGRYLKKSSLKLPSQMNPNLVGIIYMYGRACIKFPQSRMKGERHRHRPLSLSSSFTESVLLILLVFCIVVLCFVCIRPVPNVDSASGLSTLYSPFGFLQRLFRQMSDIPFCGLCINQVYLLL